eukprot:TRINITY_DN671_c0_g1_i3.p1 TRINITY_DN671_c0_g1~~TRINITY_DN671_c0_g1_i3.p1  ORF type:complete len:203 (+),score=55.52 TRINITY_DN671_c0_g1_i3:38-610(+)
MTLHEETAQEHKETATTPLVDPQEKSEPFEVYKTRTRIGETQIICGATFFLLFAVMTSIMSFIYWVPALTIFLCGVAVFIPCLVFFTRSIEIHSDRLVVKTIFFCFTTKFSTIKEVTWDDQTELNTCGFDLSTSSKGKINIFREGFCKSLVLSPLNPQEFMDRLNLAMNGTTPGGPQSMVITNNRLPEFV